MFFEEKEREINYFKQLIFTITFNIVVKAYLQHTKRSFFFLIFKFAKYLINLTSFQGYSLSLSLKIRSNIFLFSK